MSKINVLYIISTLENCGPVNILYNIVKFLDKEKFSVFIAELSSADKNSRKDEFEELDCKVFSLSLSRIKGILYNQKYICDIINENNIHVVHSHGLRADGISAKLRKVKTFTTIHNYMEYDYKMTYGNIKGKLFAFQHFKYIKQINEPIACSKSVSEYFKDVYKYKISYIQNGVDITKFKSDLKNKKDKKLSLGLPVDKKIFLVVGKINQRKNPLFILDTFNKRKKEDEILVFLGDGEQLSELERLSQHNKNIIVKGNVTNVKEYLSAADYYLSASLGEGLPNSVLEAMAMGLPCILSDIPPHGEILEYSPRCGKLFVTNDTESLSSSIDSIYKENYAQLAAGSIELISAYLSAAIMSKKYGDLYWECSK